MSNSDISGFGRGTYGQGAWNTELPVIVTGVAGTSALGSATVAAAAVVGVTGVAGTGGIGNTLVWGDIDTTQIPNWAAISTTQTPAWQDIVGV